VFERFTDQARRVVVLAQEEARLLAHDHIGAEHLLLGLVHEGDGVAARALAAAGVTLAGVRTEIERAVGRGDAPTPHHIPFTPGAKRTLEGSLREALTRGDNHIDTEHLLLGLLRADDPLVGQVLTGLGTEAAAVEAAVDRTTGPAPGHPGYENVAMFRTHGGPPFSPELSAVLGEAVAIAEEAGAPSVTPDHLMDAVARRLRGPRAERVTMRFRRRGWARSAPREEPESDAGPPDEAAGPPAPGESDT
jgi:ATP-dependent Clp protease ATP-binding subunit ClpC